jgi:hypothetical protein
LKEDELSKGIRDKLPTSDREGEKGRGRCHVGKQIMNEKDFISKTSTIFNEESF